MEKKEGLEVRREEGKDRSQLAERNSLLISCALLLGLLFLWTRNCFHNHRLANPEQGWTKTKLFWFLFQCRFHFFKKEQLGKWGLGSIFFEAIICFKKCLRDFSEGPVIKTPYLLVEKLRSHMILSTATTPPKKKSKPNKYLSRNRSEKNFHIIGAMPR